ncbi:MAG: acylneuraminate cytidylyltransferase family protein [Anaerolineae bacterium]
MTQSEVLALIPARAGSKGIPHKNIRLLGGKPLLAHSIDHARAAKRVTRIVVSTDSAEYADIARLYGAETPFLRPAELAQDFSTDVEAFEHALKWLHDHEGYVPEVCVHLRPTYPIRNPADIDAMIELLLTNPDVDSVRSVSPAPDTPFKMWFMKEDGILKPVVENPAFPEAYNMPRQALPKVYLQNACIDVVRARVIRDLHSMTGRVIHGYVMTENFDIDLEEQFHRAEATLASASPTAQSGGKIFCFDIDGVIATITLNNQYNLAQPITSAINIINRLFDEGNTIVLFTARGSATGIDWREVTRQQMEQWGVKHHRLEFGKPPADYYIDDKLISLDDLYRLFPHRDT